MMPPATIEEQHKDVYAHFGVAAARVSGLEMVLTNILLANAKKSGKVTSDEEFEKMEMNLKKSKTLGALIRTVNADVTIPELTEKLMREALERRNYLMHHFFRDKAIDFAFETETGRKRMVDELREAHAYVLAATNLANDLCVEIAKEFGINIKDIETDAENMRQKARKADQH